MSNIKSHYYRVNIIPMSNQPQQLRAEGERLKVLEVSFVNKGRDRSYLYQLHVKLSYNMHDYS